LTRWPLSADFTRISLIPAIGILANFLITRGAGFVVIHEFSVSDPTEPVVAYVAAHFIKFVFPDAMLAPFLPFIGRPTSGPVTYVLIATQTPIGLFRIVLS